MVQHPCMLKGLQFLAPQITFWQTKTHKHGHTHAPAALLHLVHTISHHGWTTTKLNQTPQYCAIPVHLIHPGSRLWWFRCRTASQAAQDTRLVRTQGWTRGHKLASSDGISATAAVLICTHASCTLQGKLSAFPCQACSHGLEKQGTYYYASFPFGRGMRDRRKVSSP